MPRRVIFDGKPKRKMPGAKSLGGVAPKGPPPRARIEPERSQTFDQAIESEGAKLKWKHPEMAAQIDRTVESFKERNKAGDFIDWLDTQFEFLDAALKPLPKPYRSGKREPSKSGRR